MLKKSIIFIIFFLLTAKNFAQNMQAGFNSLEAGKYLEASIFFKNILKKHPNNKTAKICYGRAIGLQGQSKKALYVFSELLENNPDDLEVKLNYAEGLLWNKSFLEAEAFYLNLVKTNPNSFNALLGYANTLSNLNMNTKALHYINEALKIKPGNNNALNTKKYIYLGKAYKEQKKEDYTNSEKTLKQGLEIFNNDIDLLKSLANLYLITNETKKAKLVYLNLLSLENYKLTALNGLALVEHIDSHNKKAFAYSKTAINTLKSNSSNLLKQETVTRYIQALIWNKKYKQARLLIDSLATKHPNKNWPITLRATYNTYTSNFKKSIEDYNKVLITDSSSFDGNLGKANALKALGKHDLAYQAANKTLSFYNNQKDALRFIDKLDKKFTPFTEAKTYYSFDNGNNKAYAINTKINLPTSTKFSWLGSYGYRITDNKITNSNAKSNQLQLGAKYQIKNNIYLKSLVGVTGVNTLTNNYAQFTNQTILNIVPFKLSLLDVGFKSEVQDFNADLLNRQIVMNHLFTNFNIATNFNLGWYTQYFYTFQNDKNVRQLFFTSLYYNLLSKPLLKTGLNYQYIGFKNQVPNLYFSPQKFNALEVFINIIKNENSAKNKSWFYELTTAIGLQYINNTTQQNTYRIQGKLGYKFTPRTLFNMYATRSNIASTTAAGFTYNEIGLRFKWYPIKSKIFKLNNNAPNLPTL